MTDAYEGMAKGAGASYSEEGLWREVNILQKEQENKFEIMWTPTSSSQGIQSCKSRGHMPAPQRKKHPAHHSQL
jgi:hypothetical protein